MRGPSRRLRHLPINQIIVDRHSITPKTLAYADAMRAGAMFPPIRVQALEGGLYRIRDGRHRITAAKLCGYRTILARYGRRARPDEPLRPFLGFIACNLEAAPLRIAWGDTA